MKSTCSRKRRRSDSPVDELVKTREENLKKNVELMEFLGLSQKKEKKIQHSQKKKSEEKVPERKSPRLQKVKAEIEVTPKALNIVESPPHLEKKPAGPFAFEEVALHSDNLTEVLIKKIPFTSNKMSGNGNFNWDNVDFHSMVNTPSLVMKLVLSRICCVTFHPNQAKTLVCCGSNTGQIGFWDVESRNVGNNYGKYMYEPHSERVSCLEFNLENSHELYSSSFDGSFRCADMTSGIFHEVYRTSDKDDELCSYFDFLSAMTFLVCHRNGVITIVDKRTGNIHGERSHDLHHHNLKTVHVHPLQKSYFVTAASDGYVSLWDVRKMKKAAIQELNYTRSVSSAYFSPLSGKFIIATCMDDTVRIINCPVLGNEMKEKKMIRHNNYTGRWLTPFRAVWLPNKEDAFVIGCIKCQPRHIEIYEVNGKVIHSFGSDSMGSVCSINAFHHSKPVLAGGNSSGKIHVFMSVK